MTLRSPICAIEGHVDHGKTSILDKIRGTSVIKGEAGKITQVIGASIIPLETIKKISGQLLEKLNLNLTIPGLLVIDTPGHAAFNNLRKRGGALADIAILVVDINEGPKPQTIEAIEILKSDKTPFIIAANKIDLLPYLDFDMDRFRKGVEALNEDVLTFPLSCRTGEGIEAWIEWIAGEVGKG